MSQESVQQRIRDLDVPLDRDVFLRNLIRALAGTLEEVVGITEASGFVSVVGQTIGDEVNRDYRLALAASSLTRQQVAAVLVDLKRRIDGDFYVIEEDDTKIVLENRRCPFEDKVLGRRSMCMMTSNVFGSIAAEISATPRSSCRKPSQLDIPDAGSSCICSQHPRPRRPRDGSITRPGRA